MFSLLFYYKLIHSVIINFQLLFIRIATHLARLFLLQPTHLYKHPQPQLPIPNARAIFALAKLECRISSVSVPDAKKTLQTTFAGLKQVYVNAHTRTHTHTERLRECERERESVSLGVDLCLLRRIVLYSGAISHSTRYIFTYVHEYTHICISFEGVTNHKSWDLDKLTLISYIGRIALSYGMHYVYVYIEHVFLC